MKWPSRAAEPDAREEDLGRYGRPGLFQICGILFLGIKTCARVIHGITLRETEMAKQFRNLGAGRKRLRIGIPHRAASSWSERPRVRVTTVGDGPTSRRTNIVISRG
jgi:hypothetical protein